MMLFLMCPCRGILILSCVCYQPKDTQQALSRKESAVNMEKFKKFAARRKWKVNLRFMAGGGSFFCSPHSQPELYVGIITSDWTQSATHFLTVTLWPPRKQRETEEKPCQTGCHHNCSRLAVSIQTARLRCLLAVSSLSVCVRHGWPGSAVGHSNKLGIVCLHCLSSVDCSVS